MVRRIIIFGAVIAVALQIEQSVFAQSPKIRFTEESSTINQDIETVKDQIQSCPNWSELTQAEIRKLNLRIIKCLSLISKNDVSIIRDAIKSMFDEKRTDTSLWSKVFMLNRYLFQVPEKSPIDNNLFGGWVGVPMEGGTVNRLWPFMYNSRGEVELVGQFQGYFGSGYKGLEEFDYFWNKFGVRR